MTGVLVGASYTLRPWCVLARTNVTDKRVRLDPKGLVCENQEAS